jgi:hypothetical protein
LCQKGEKGKKARDEFFIENRISGKLFKIYLNNVVFYAATIGRNILGIVFLVAEILVGRDFNGESLGLDKVCGLDFDVDFLNGGSLDGDFELHSIILLFLLHCAKTGESLRNNRFGFLMANGFGESCSKSL